jgi:two-component system heavy metal sensor histidine kinase CusS
MTPSIARRLTLLVGALAAVVFGVLSTLLYLGLERELTRRDVEELSGKVEFVQHVLSEMPDLTTLETWRHHLDDMIASHGDLRVWITRVDSGALVYGSTPVPQVLPRSTPEPFAFSLADGTPMRGVAEHVPARGDMPALALLIGVDLRPTGRVLANFALALGVLWLAGVASMLALGSWVARRGLAPVKTLSRQARSIGPSALSQRLPEQGIPGELVMLAQSFNHVLDRLEQAYRQLEAFNADVAHELRTPLTSLIASTEVTLSRERTTDELYEVLVSNLEELRRMTLIVNDMLFLARADRGERAIGDRVSLDQVARDVADFLESVLEERRMVLAIDGRATVSGDAGLLRRALMNLLANALAHTADGGRIRIRIRAHADSAVLGVLNPGPAIPVEHLPHIFDRFYRLDAARTGRRGHGLGLAIVKAIVGMHGGEVYAECQDGTTEVGFRLPLAASDRITEPQPAPGHDAIHNPRKQQQA